MPDRREGVEMLLISSLGIFRAAQAVCQRGMGAQSFILRAVRRYRIISKLSANKRMSSAFQDKCMFYSTSSI